MDEPDELPVERFEDACAMDAWLATHHARETGIWMQIAKKGSPLQSVTMADAVPVALRWGWIDGQLRRLDADSYLVRLTPRRPRSVWSKVNVAHVERLMDEGRMQPAGLAKVDAAKADGRWDAAYGSGASMEVPIELEEALQASRRAASVFEALGASERFSMCWKVHTARRAETRTRRAAAFVAQLEDQAAGS